jgi:alpha-ketoglutaric semialdehyde dehydrogenase
LTVQPVLIAGAWRQSTHLISTFTADDPATGQALPEVYPLSGLNEVNEACEAGKAAAVALRDMPDREERIAAFLEGFAAAIEASADALCTMANRETAYPVTPRLKAVELPRTTNQLRQAASAARGRSWSMATIDTKLNIRSHFGPLGGPVVVFGPNNFPFAFNSLAGGDFAAAVAAGNPVIGKANTSHPGTTRIFAELAFEAAKAAGLPPAMVQLLYRVPAEAGFMLVSHPAVGATGFTGSKYAGLQLKAAAEKAGKPIYLEMSSVNPVFVLPAAIEERGSALAKELFDSCALGAGQFCTRPGLTIVAGGERGEAFVKEVAGFFGGGTPGVLLGKSGLSSVTEAVKTLAAHGASILAGGHPVDAPGFRYAPTLLTVSGDQFLADSHALQTEAFASVNTIVVARDIEQMAEIAATIDGSLTGCLYTDTTGKDDAVYSRIAPILRQRVGRLLNDKMPTGVAVTPAMNHGGPFPSTGHPGFTAVGIPASMLRFAALHSYDNVRPHRLPPELQDKNPTGSMWRSIDGAWTQGDVAS